VTTWSVRTVGAADSRFALFPSMGEYQAYDDHVYDAFDAADDRHRAYRDAVRAASPGKVVLDIGTGRDALWAIEAARAGARHVYAIEADPGTADRAVEATESAGLSDRVTVLAGLSRDHTLPARADVCVSEIVGNIATAEGAIPTLADARARLCAPACVWIPFRIQTWAAAVDLSAAGPLAIAAESLPYLHSIFDTAGGPFDLRLCLAGPADETVISSCAAIESTIFDTVSEGAGDVVPEGGEIQDDSDVVTEGGRLEGSRTEGGGIELRIAVDATMTGVLLWTRVAVSARGGREVDALAGGTQAWAPVYVPLPEARPVGRGDHLTLALTRAPSDDGVHPDYALSLDGDPVWRSPHHGGPFRATAFYRALFPET
jgi:protein arginine N-methyltransferase 1